MAIPYHGNASPMTALFFVELSLTPYPHLNELGRAEGVDSEDTPSGEAPLRRQRKGAFEHARRRSDEPSRFHADVATLQIDQNHV